MPRKPRRDPAKDFNFRVEVDSVPREQASEQRSRLSDILSTILKKAGEIAASAARDLRG
jgi:hypothetical protein